MAVVWEWLTQHSAPVQAIVGAITAFVWLVYLQILVSGFRRQRRTEILIHLGGSAGTQARVFVSNLGFEPIYILDILLGAQTIDTEREIAITDRTELTQTELSSPSATTLQGPLKSGEFVDIGSVDNLLDRARHRTAQPLDAASLDWMSIKVAAIKAGSSGLVAARRQFYIDSADGQCKLRPASLYARQICSWSERRQLRRQLQQRL